MPPIPAHALGPGASRTLLADLPEFGRLSRREIAKLSFLVAASRYSAKLRHASRTSVSVPCSATTPARASSNSTDVAQPALADPPAPKYLHVGLVVELACTGSQYLHRAATVVARDCTIDHHKRRAGFEPAAPFRSARLTIWYLRPLSHGSKRRTFETAAEHLQPEYREQLAEI